MRKFIAVLYIFIVFVKIDEIWVKNFGNRKHTDFLDNHNPERLIFF